MATDESITEEQALFVEMLVNGLPLEVAAAELGLDTDHLSAWLSSERFAYLVKTAQEDLDATELKLINIELVLGRSAASRGSKDSEG